MTERIKGNAEYVAGATKETLGSMVGSERMKAEGAAAKTEGASRVDAAKTGKRTEGKAEELKGNVKETTGNLTGSNQMQAEGQTDQSTGQGNKTKS
ncbi:4212_t:CDS:2 [Ambispora leptoticha]|uniref:4212_t:CDS:1 n=1 Tax=Ambispora leptoticha TaxID=144679 RepID=A0A9N9H4P8_9GLOM|nr:4212_t:CDS:2 [Ambispora leptoticha]